MSDDEWTNRAALLAADPGLAVRLGGLSPGPELRQRPDGAWVWGRGGHRPQPIAWGPAEISAAQAALPADASEVVVLGPGDGALLRALLDAGRTVWAWARDPRLLLPVLSAPGLAGALRSGRLRLVAGVDLLRVPVRPAVAHPLFALPWAQERRGWEAGGPGARPVALVWAGGLFVDDIAEVLAGAGAFPWGVDSAPDELARAAAVLGAQAVYAVNHTVGLAEQAAALGLHLREWEVDPALDSLRPPAGPVGSAAVFTWRAAAVPGWQSAGWARVHHLPLAAHPARRRPLHGAGPPIAVGFVGNSMVGEARRCLALLHTELDAFCAVVPGLDAAGAQRRLRRALDRQLAAPREWLLPEAVDEVLPGFRRFVRLRGHAWSVDAVLGEVAAAEKRLRVVGALAERGVDVWGDAGWAAHARQPGVRHHGPVGHLHALTEVYNRVQINVDINRLYQPDIVTMRVFDVLACGGFVLAEHSAEIGALFDVGREVVTWDGIPDLRAKVAHFLAHPAEAAAIAAAGRARVLRDHTVERRLRQMESLDGGPRFWEGSSA